MNGVFGSVIELPWQFVLTWSWGVLLRLIYALAGAKAELRRRLLDLLWRVGVGARSWSVQLFGNCQLDAHGETWFLHPCWRSILRISAWGRRA